MPRTELNRAKDLETSVAAAPRLDLQSVHSGRADIEQWGAAGPNPEFVEALQGWHHAREEASRHNRNLLQYAGGIIAVLSIGAGSGSVFALAGSLSQASEDSQALPDWAASILAVAAAVVVVFTVALTLLLIRSFIQRHNSERAVDHWRAELITQAPERFMPGPAEEE